MYPAKLWEMYDFYGTWKRVDEITGLNARVRQNIVLAQRLVQKAVRCMRLMNRTIG